MFIAPEDILAKSSPMTNMSTYLKSYYSTTLHNINETELFVKTEDLNTSCGIVFLAHKDFSVVNEDIEFLRSVEKNTFELVLNREADENYSLDEEKIINDLKNLIEITDKYGNGLLITDQEISDVNILQVNSENVNNLHGHFDYIILNLNYSLIDEHSERAVESLLKIISYIKVGGVIFIPKSTYDYVPGGRKGVEALVKNMDLNIEAPPFGIKDAVIASKTN